MSRKLKPIVCSARPEILDRVARAASEGSLRLPIAETVPLGEAIRLIGELEAGKRIGGKGLIAVE